MCGRYSLKFPFIESITAIMYFIKIYFILGLAMLLVVLWDYKYVPKTASRLTKQAGENESGFSLITSAIRNLMLMALFAFFLWPVVVGMELFGKNESSYTTDMAYDVAIAIIHQKEKTLVSNCS
jgi:hypothetical protein